MKIYQSCLHTIIPWALIVNVNTNVLTKQMILICLRIGGQVQNKTMNQPFQNRFVWLLMFAKKFSPLYKTFKSYNSHLLPTSLTSTRIGYDRKASEKKCLSLNTPRGYLSTRLHDKKIKLCF